MRLKCCKNKYWTCDDPKLTAERKVRFSALVGLAKSLTSKSRKEGILALENLIDEAMPALLKIGLQLLTYGSYPEELDAIISLQVAQMERGEKLFGLCIWDILHSISKGCAPFVAVMRLLSYISLDSDKEFFDEMFAQYAHPFYKKIEKAKFIKIGVDMKLQDDFIEEVLSHTNEVLSIEDNRNALKAIITSAIKLGEASRRDGLASLAKYVIVPGSSDKSTEQTACTKEGERDCKDVSQARFDGARDGEGALTLPLPPLLNLGVMLLSDNFDWEDTQFIITNEITLMGSAAQKLFGLVTLTALMGLQKGEHPRVTSYKLLSFIPLDTQKEFYDSMAAAVIKE